MSPHSPASPPATVRKRNSRRKRLFLLGASIATAVAVLSCPFTQNALAGTRTNRRRGTSQLFARAVFAHYGLPSSSNQGYWHTEGGRIVSVGGSSVRISGVNWSGFETTNMVPGGLKVQDYRAILRAIRASGYNSVRIPFSNQMIESPIVPSEIRFENAAGEPINSDLADLDALQILDHIIDAAGQAGLKVILDNHRSEAGSSAEASGLWYTEQYPESAWIADWTSLAARYKRNPTVIGFDLRNEPHNATQGGACWSCGGATDWHLAAQRAGNAILRTNPSLLLFVEGTDTVAGETDFWGGNLAGVRTAPIHLALPGRLVYSVHVYGPAEYQQSWFNASTTPASLATLYHRHWGFISDAGIAPVWIGEFGTPNTDADVSSTEPGSEGQWFQALVAYLGAHPNVGWSYWGINGEDRYGLLNATYTATPANTLKAQALASIRLPRAIQDLPRSTPERTTFAVQLATVPQNPAPSTEKATPVKPWTKIPADSGQPVKVVAAAESQISVRPEDAVAEQVRLATSRALNNLPGD